MKAWKILLGAAGFLGVVQLVAADMPKLTAYERSQGWRYLFDGQSLSSWRGYHLNKVPANWQVAEGQLTGGEGAALVTSEDFKDFELSFDWKVSAGGHAEVYYRADEDAKEPATSGPLMQLAGDSVVMGGNGGLSKPWREITLQPDVWYRAKISVFGYQVEHWINGDRVLTYLIDSPDWRAAVAGSSYKGVRDYGLQTSGSIIFSGSGAMFRNVKIRPL